MLREKEAELRKEKEKMTELQQRIKTKEEKLSRTQEQLGEKEEHIMLIFVMSLIATLFIAFVLQVYINHAVKKEMDVTISKLNETIETILTMAAAEIERKASEVNMTIAKLNETMETKLKTVEAETERKEIEMNMTITKLHKELYGTMAKLESKENELNVQKMEKELEMIVSVRELQKEQNTTMIKVDGKEENVTETNIRVLMRIKPLIKYSNVSGPGLTSATINQSTYVLVDLADYDVSQIPLQLNVTAQLELIPKATLTNKSEDTPTNQSITTSLLVVMKSPSRYNLSYTAVSRGQHKLHILVNNREINGSPFRVTVYPDPRQLYHPVRTVTDLTKPYGIALNNHEQMIVTENTGHTVSIFENEGKKIGIFGSFGDREDQMNYPCGVATDDVGNIYVSSEHKLQKFNSNWKLIKCIGRQGNKEKEFDDPHGITVYNNQLYVCDTYNHRIQVFDLDLNFVQIIGSRGEGRGEFNRPYDVEFDTAGNMYVTERSNSRVQVFDSSGRYMRYLGQEEGEGKLRKPSGLHITDKYVYVSEWNSHFIVVYETSGQFVTLLGGHGSNYGEFNNPYCIISDFDGLIYVCDSNNNRIQIF